MKIKCADTRQCITLEVQSVLYHESLWGPTAPTAVMRSFVLQHSATPGCRGPPWKSCTSFPEALQVIKVPTVVIHFHSSVNFRLTECKMTTPESKGRALTLKVCVLYKLHPSRRISISCLLFCFVKCHQRNINVLSQHNSISAASLEM